MIVHRSLAIVLGATALTVGAVAVAHGFAQAAQNPIVVQRFLLGYMDKKGRFIPTSGRNATNVSRNALALFTFNGAVDMGPNLRATLPLTLAEQKELEDRIQSDPDYDPTKDGYEPGVIPRKRSDDRSALYVATGSVDVFSVTIGAGVGGGTSTAPGQFFKFLKPRSTRPTSHQFLFNPRYTVSTFNKPGEIDYRPEALDANTTYNVYLDGGPKPVNASQTLRNLDGLSLATPFSTSFTTTSRYVQDYTRPEVSSTSPSDESTNVAYDADIDIEFDEPMDVASFVTPRFQGDELWTMNVRYTQNAAVNGSLAGRNILGTVRIKPQTAGNVVQFRPLQGFGKGPYDVEVVVTNGVTDLSGNNIIRQFQYTFKTEYNASAEDFSVIDETFDTTTQRDASFVPSGDYLPAEWNNVGFRGLLRTSVQEGGFDAVPPNNNGQVNVWYHLPIRSQQLYPPSTMGNRARTIGGFSWITGTYLGRTYPQFSLQLGHANAAVDAGGFPGSGPSNFNFGDTPVQVVPAATYSTTATPPSGVYVKGPDFLKTFNYDGQRALIFDMSHNGDPLSNGNWERWRIDSGYPINCLTVLIGGAPSTFTWFCWTRFSYLTPGAEARSNFYDVGRGNARLLPQQIVPFTQPAGTSVVFLWQGAREDASIPNQIDMSTLTPWVADVRQLSNYRYIKWQVTLVNNTTAKTSPLVDTLSIPFVFK